jgi:hypothetical protein
MPDSLVLALRLAYPPDIVDPTQQDIGNAASHAAIIARQAEDYYKAVEFTLGAGAGLDALHHKKALSIVPASAKRGLPTPQPPRSRMSAS